MGKVGSPVACSKDPDGHSVHVVHAFRRTPLAAVHLQCKSLAHAVPLYESVFGFRKLTEEEKNLPVSEASHLNHEGKKEEGKTAVLTLGHADNTTILCLRETAGLEPGRSASPLAVTLEVDDVPALHTAVASAGWEATELEKLQPAATAGGSEAGSSAEQEASTFTCVDADDNFFHIVPRGYTQNLWKEVA